MKIKEFLREDPKQNSNALPNIALFRRLSFVVLKTTKFLYVMLLYPFYAFVRLSADVSYFLCCPRKSDAVPFLRAAKEIYRRRLHAGNVFVSVKIEKKKKAYCARVIIKATSPQLLLSQDLDQLLRLRRSENDQ